MVWYVLLRPLRKTPTLVHNCGECRIGHISKYMLKKEKKNKRDMCVFKKMFFLKSKIIVSSLKLRPFILGCFDIIWYNIKNCIPQIATLIAPLTWMCRALPQYRVLVGVAPLRVEQLVTPLASISIKSLIHVLPISAVLTSVDPESRVNDCGSAHTWYWTQQYPAS
jgi:hypothetical protein